jgi:uncharacterized protein
MAQKSILSNTPENLIKKYYQELINANIPVEKIILFGSYAKGNPKPWSDLDICVVSKIFGKNNYDETVFLNQLASRVDSMIEPHPYNPSDLKNSLDPLAYEINKTGLNYLNTSY